MREKWTNWRSVRYALALVVIATAFFVREVLLRVVGELPPYIVFYPAVMLVSVIAGVGPGVFATALSALTAAVWIFPPQGQLAVSKLEDAGSLSLFSAMGVLLSVVAERYRRLRQKAATYEAQEAIRAREEMLRALTDHSIDAIYVKDQHSRWQFANPALLSVVGKSAEEVIGRTDAEIYSDPEIGRVILENDRQVLEGGEPGTYEESAETPGGVRVFLSTKAPRRDAQGRVTGLVGISRDITERKRAEAELQQAKADAEHANQAKDHFLAILSHELRTPLAPVLTATALMERDRQFPDRYREDIAMIRRNVELEARLIDDLLDVTRIIRGKVEIDRKPVRLCDVIRQAVEVCKPDIEARRLEFELDLGPDVPYVVEAEAARLQQVFWNLIKNAIKFTPNGGSVGVVCRREDDYVIAEVNDSGIGIEPELLPKMFNAFEQGGSVTTRQFGGLGLGLTISKGLVEMHGGTITAHSAGRNRGASFRVKLPLVRTVWAEVPSRPSGTPPAPATTGSKSALDILVVEDHGDTARIMKRLLMAGGHQVQTAGDVATALVMALRQRFDLLISDLGLPDGSGIDLMRELRQRGYQMPGIALTGYGQEDDIQRGKEAGFAAHLIKPIALDRLAEAIATVTHQPPAPQKPSV